MRILLLTLFSFLWIQQVKADTLDYWHVWLDDSLIGKFNVADIQREVVLSDKRIRNGSQLKVKYVSDLTNAQYHCYFMDDDYQFAESEVAQNGEVMLMSLKALAVSGPPAVPMYYDVYLETILADNRTYVLLFQVKWE